MSSQTIPFNTPYMTGKELYYIASAHFGNRLAGDGTFTKKCHHWLEKNTGTEKALLTHSCTAALEMAALLLDIMPGDEVIMPSYTFVSTANAFVLRGAVIVFVDIRADTMNIDEKLIESAITSKTRAIVVVHYAGVSCEMDTVMAVAASHGLKVVEDAAQAIFSTYKGKPLGTIGELGTYSFHETKNVISGEGGALLIKDKSLILRAEIIREKGTDRSQFFRGQIDKYTWQAAGSSYLPGEITAAFLWAQLEEATDITNSRLILWDNYHKMLESLETKGLVKRPKIPIDCKHNGHMYYIVLAPHFRRDTILNTMNIEKINAVFHYVPLHSSPGGRRYGRAHGTMDVTELNSESLIRLPLWIGMSIEQQHRVIDVLCQTLSTLA